MFKRIGIIVGLLIALFSPKLGFAAPAVLIEEVSPAPSAASSEKWVERERGVSESRPLREIYAEQEFTSAYEMRTKRRVGVGLMTAGQVGMAGALVELNFAPEDGFFTSYGGGPKYNAFAMGWYQVV